MQHLAAERSSGLKAPIFLYWNTPEWRRSADPEQPRAGRSRGVLDRAFSKRKNKERSLRVSLECLDLCVLTTEESKDGLCPGVTNRQPDDFWRTAVEETELSEVIVLGNDRITLLPGPLPNHVVRRALQAERADMGTPRILRFESLDEPGAQVLVKE